MNVYFFQRLLYHKLILKTEDRDMATNKRVFTLRLSDDVFDKIGVLATNEHRSMTNYIEYVLIQHLEQIEKNHGKIKTDKLQWRSVYYRNQNLKLSIQIPENVQNIKFSKL